MFLRNREGCVVQTVGCFPHRHRILCVTSSGHNGFDPGKYGRAAVCCIGRTPCGDFQRPSYWFAAAEIVSTSRISLSLSLSTR